MIRHAQADTWKKEVLQMGRFLFGVNYCSFVLNHGIIVFF